MSSRSASFVRVGVALAALISINLACTAPMLAQQPVTVWSGVYSDEQAQRGKRLYAQHCSYCHHDDLLGGEDLAVVPPALVAIAFEERWNGKTVGALFQSIATTMPWRRPLLTAAIYADVVSYLLKENGFPAGARELPADVGELDRIAISMQKP